MNARLTQLVESTVVTSYREELYHHRTTPVVGLLVFLTVIIGKKTDFLVIQIFVVGLNREYGEGDFPWVEDVRLCCAHR